LEADHDLVLSSQFSFTSSLQHIARSLCVTMIAPNFVTTVLLLCMLAHAAPSPRPASEAAIGSPAHERALDWLAKEDYHQVAAIKEERRDGSLARTLIARARKAALPSTASWVAALNHLLSPLGLQVSSDASKHGRYWSLNYGFDRSARRKVNKHNVPWQQPFVGWNSYKANGVNLGKQCPIFLKIPDLTL